MFNIKGKYIYFSILTIIGYGYFSVISNLPISNFWHGEMVLIPLQLITLIYLIYIRRMERDVSTESVHERSVK